MLSVGTALLHACCQWAQHSCMHVVSGHSTAACMLSVGTALLHACCQWAQHSCLHVVSGHSTAACMLSVGTALLHACCQWAQHSCMHTCCQWAQHSCLHVVSGHSTAAACMLSVGTAQLPACCQWAQHSCMHVVSGRCAEECLWLVAASEREVVLRSCFIWHVGSFHMYQQSRAASVTRGAWRIRRSLHRCGTGGFLGMSEPASSALGAKFGCAIKSTCIAWGLRGTNACLRAAAGCDQN
jgi:hypothetical protein